MRDRSAQIVGPATGAQKIDYVIGLSRDEPAGLRTNLFAPTTIEAARAGEAGKASPAPASEANRSPCRPPAQPRISPATPSAVRTRPRWLWRRSAGDRRAEGGDQSVHVVEVRLRSGSRTPRPRISTNVASGRKAPAAMYKVTLARWRARRPEIRGPVEIVLGASETVETAVSNLRTEVEAFLGRAVVGVPGLDWRRISPKEACTAAAARSERVKANTTSQSSLPAEQKSDQRPDRHRGRPQMLIFRIFLLFLSAARDAHPHQFADALLVDRRKRFGRGECPAPAPTPRKLAAATAVDTAGGLLSGR